MRSKPSLKQSIAYYLTHTDALRIAFISGLSAFACIAVMAAHSGGF